MLLIRLYIYIIIIMAKTTIEFIRSFIILCLFLYLRATLDPPMTVYDFTLIHHFTLTCQTK